MQEFFEFRSKHDTFLNFTSISRSVSRGNVLRVWLRCKPLSTSTAGLFSLAKCKISSRNMRNSKLFFSVAGSYVSMSSFAVSFKVHRTLIVFT
uniref:Uncharacterized protein n=1 Tax=Anopheles dirus TaxID=7168 RepID=A0A182NY42_9DIPT